MIGDHGEVILMDFGMHTFSDEAPNQLGLIPIPASWPYKPAEELVLFGGTLPRTKAMDVYAFATTVHSVRFSQFYKLQSPH